jgi:hypothetical protein
MRRLDAREQDFQDMEERRGGGGAGAFVVALLLCLVLGLTLILIIILATTAPSRGRLMPSYHKIRWGAAFPIKHAARRGSGGADVTPPVSDNAASLHR